MNVKHLLDIRGNRGDILRKCVDVASAETLRTNSCTGRPLGCKDFMAMIEKKLGKKANIVHKPTHPADMEATWADITKAEDILKWQPTIKLRDGLVQSITWFLTDSTTLVHLLSIR